MSNEQPTNKKIAFIDRDGVINKKAPDHSYITNVDSFVFNEGVFGVLNTLLKNGFELIIITNQRGVARGLMSEQELRDLHLYMLKILKEHGITVLDVLYCPHEKDQCDCRKPKPGLLKQACAKYSVNLQDSILISDSIEDVEMGKKFGIKSFLIPVDSPEFLTDSPQLN